MPAKYIRRALPIGGMNNSMPSEGLPEGQTQNLLNVRFRFNEIRPAPGWATLAGPLDAPIQVICRFSPNDTQKWICAITDKSLYRWGNNIPGDVQAWTKCTGPTLTGQGRWSWTTGEDQLFFTRKNAGGVYHWPGGTAAYAMVPNVPFSDARFVCYYNNRLNVGNVAEAGSSWSQRVRYPVNGDYTNWSGVGSGFIDLYEPEQEPIQGLRVLGNRMVALREHSLTDLVASGTTAQVYNLEQRTSGVGCPFPHTIDCNGTFLVFLGNDGNVWSWNGSQLQSVGDALYRSFENIMDMSGSKEIYFGKIYAFMNEYWLWLNDGKVYVFDFLQGRWMVDTFPKINAIGDAEFITTPNSWGAATGTWGSRTVPWSAMAAQATSRLIVGLNDYSTVTVGKDIIGRSTGEVIDSFVETKDYYANESNNPIGVQDPVGPFIMRTCERLLLMYMYNNDPDTFELAVSNDHGATWTTFQVTPNKFGFGLADWKVTGNVMRFRVRQSSTAPVFRWQGLIEENVPGGPYQALEQPPGFTP